MGSITPEENLPRLIRYFLIFSLFYYVYIYAFRFEQGISWAPAPVKALKDVIYLGVVATLVLILRWPKLRMVPKQGLIFAPFLAALILVSVLHSVHSSWISQLWENIKNIAVYIPLYTVPFLVNRETHEAIVRDIFLLVPVVAVAQCMFVVFYHGSGLTLWDGGVYAGFMGNPNSFALLLNFATACLLATLSTQSASELIVSYSLVGIFTYIILGTTSGSQFIILWFLLLFAFAFRIKYWKRYLAAIVVCSAVVAISSVEVDKTLFTLRGAGSIITGAGDPTEDVYISRSVTVRKKNWADTLAVFSKGISDITFGDFDAKEFKPMDGQYLVFMFNGGLLTLLTFLVGAAFVYLKTLAGAWKYQDDCLFGLNLIIAAFGITFLASRSLMYFPFNFLFFLIAGLATAGAIRIKGGMTLR